MADDLHALLAKANAAVDCLAAAYVLRPGHANRMIHDQLVHHLCQSQEGLAWVRIYLDQRPKESEECP